MQFESFATTVSNNREVATVQGQDARRAHAFCEHSDGCIGRTEREITVGSHEFADSQPVRRLGGDHPKIREPADKTGFGLRTVATA